VDNLQISLDRHKRKRRNLLSAAAPGAAPKPAAPWGVGIRHAPNDFSARRGRIAAQHGRAGKASERYAHKSNRKKKPPEGGS